MTDLHLQILADKRLPIINRRQSLGIPGYRRGQTYDLPRQYSRRISDERG
jgi:hypothetical protein